MPRRVTFLVHKGDGISGNRRENLYEELELR